MNSDDIYFVYNGLHESEIFWMGQARFFDEMGGQFDIKPYYKFIIYSYKLCFRIRVHYIFIEICISCVVQQVWKKMQE